MKLCSLGSRIILSAAIVLFSVSAHAGGLFAMSGKAGRSAGTDIDIPGSGATPCPSLVLGINTAQTMGGPVTPPISMASQVANPGGCIKGDHNGGLISATGASPAGFKVPVGAFSQMVPGALVVNTVPVSNVVQLATSWSVMGPLAAPLEARDGSMATGCTGTGTGCANQADWRQFKKDAWAEQSGRAAATFTWCYGNDACTNVSGGTAGMITKYTGGVNKFGGTMALTLKGGPNAGSVAFVNAAGLPAGAIVMAGLGGMNPMEGSFPAGRGYAAYDHDQLQPGPIYANYTVTGAGLLGMVSNYLFGFPAGTQMNRGFPWSTGTVVVRKTGLDGGGNPANDTMTAMGADNRTGNGAGNITLVAGSMAVNSFGNKTPSMEIMKLDFTAVQTPALSSRGLVGLAAIMLIGAMWFGRGFLKSATN